MSGVEPEARAQLIHLKSNSPSRVLLATLLFIALAPALLRADGNGALVRGSDTARVRVPTQAKIVPYQNLGYSLGLDGEEQLVEVQVEPLGNSAPFSFGSGSHGSSDPVGRLAASLVKGETGHYQAISRLLSWLSRNIAYDLDRSKPQDAVSVLERRSGYCTGVSRLSVALLRSVGIEAREVPGFVFHLAQTGASGYHRWIEVYYPGQGWAFSDPLTTHHYVPASYVRLASETLDLTGDARADMLARQSSIAARDVYVTGPAGVLARSNSEKRVAGAVSIRIEPQIPALARLTGGGIVRSRAVEEGRAVFLGLADGEYEVSILLSTPDATGGRPITAKKIMLSGRELLDVVLPIRPESESAGRRSSG